MCEFSVREKSSLATQPLRLPFPSPRQEAESVAAKRTMVVAAALPLRRPPLLWRSTHLKRGRRDDEGRDVWFSSSVELLIISFLNLMALWLPEHTIPVNDLGQKVPVPAFGWCVHGKVNPGDQGSHNKMAAAKLDSFWKWDWEGIAATRSIQAEDN
ncbi:hypothetical protein DdX_01400 [Ditylenchus destructor]|uniref:Uncharacterized protein n=1 Tax=Ditylenchus destructor TaxID=166010 RepID=A0AAD4NFI2_9BILA|nr:hypothetical protein DdX_01400 [Ditylenchus destructor]